MNLPALCQVFAQTLSNSNISDHTLSGWMPFTNQKKIVDVHWMKKRSDQSKTDKAKHLVSACNYLQWDLSNIYGKDIRIQNLQSGANEDTSPQARKTKTFLYCSAHQVSPSLPWASCWHFWPWPEQLFFRLQINHEHIPVWPVMAYPIQEVLYLYIKIL
jgi:hypothetical protein